MLWHMRIGDSTSGDVLLGLGSAVNDKNQGGRDRDTHETSLIIPYCITGLWNHAKHFVYLKYKIKFKKDKNALPKN